MKKWPMLLRTCHLCWQSPFSSTVFNLYSQVLFINIWFKTRIPIWKKNQNWILKTDRKAKVRKGWSWTLKLCDLNRSGYWSRVAKLCSICEHRVLLCHRYSCWNGAWWDSPFASQGWYCSHSHAAFDWCFICLTKLISSFVGYLDRNVVWNIYPNSTVNYNNIQN